MHVYAFGSLCRGNILRDSDIDLLAIVSGFDNRFDPSVFSIYSYERIDQIWREGNPFAWHLALEARPVFLADEIDYLKQLGSPASYKSCVRDCENFLMLFRSARQSTVDNRSVVFDLSTAFLSIRNLATCFSLGATKHPDFSRNAALRLYEKSIPLRSDIYTIFERARILSTRGKGRELACDEVRMAIDSFNIVEEWMERLIREARS
jgi:Nucleotidyltransferase domain